MNPTQQRFASTGLIVGVFVLWELFCLIAGISELILPRPSRIVASFIEYAPAIWPHAWQTLYTTMVGFSFGVMIGLSLGVLIGSSRLAYDTAYPLLVGISSIPKVAVVPIFVLWFGAGTVPAILTAMIICIFPIVVNVSTGIATVEPELEDVMKSLKASKWETLINIGIPRSMPYFFASLKVAITLSFVGSVIADTVASNKGVGNMMLIASSSFNVPLVFAGLMVLAVMGVSLYALFAVLERRVTGWAMRKEI
jgi:NitT/TauT family transport system permease protein